MDVTTSINGMAEAVKKCDRQLAVYTRVGERLEGFLRENQSPRVRQDSKRLKRTRDQSPAPEIVDLERESNAQTTTRQAPAPMVQATPQNEGTHSATRQSAPPPGTVLHNGGLATQWWAQTEPQFSVCQALNPPVLELLTLPPQGPLPMTPFEC